jgi:kynurenine formamidase
VGKRLSNWGRWGAEDQRGALNLLTDDRVLRALSIPRRGQVFPLGTEVGRSGPISGSHRNPTWHLTIQASVPGEGGRGRAEDILVMHTHAHTHIDGLAHVWYGDKLYNGVPAEKAVTRAGTKHASVEHYGPIIGSAIILDVSQQRSLAEGDLITADDLERAARDANVTPSDADIILVRTAWIDVHYKDPERYAEGEPGLGPDGAEWIAAQDPAALGMDNYGIEPFPAPDENNPLACHELFLRDLGIPLIENLDLSGPASEGAAGGLFVATPLKISRGLGSPLNPVLIV